MNESNSTRNQILYILKTKGPLTVSKLAEEIGVTEMAVRRQIYNLDKEGYIQARLLRQAVGRPTTQYCLTAKAEEMFPKSYASFTLELLRDMEENDGKEWIDRFFKNREKRLFEQHQAEFIGKTLEEKVKKLAEIQDQKGYMVQWELMPHGGYRLVEYNCPISQVANQYLQACQCEINLFRKLIGEEVEQVECKAKGGKHCVYHIRKKSH